MMNGAGPMDAATSAGVARLEGEMRRQLAGRIGGLRLMMHGDGFILQGFARSHHAKQIAQHMAVESTRLTLLANEIQVEVATSAAIPDKERGREQ
jgi:hypothetical protein